MTEPKRNPYILRTSEDSIVVPRRIAALIDREVSAVRVRLRGVDPQASIVLEGLHLIALEWRGCVGAIEVDESAQPVRDSTMTTSQVTSTQVADQLGISPQAIRKVIADGRLPAEKVGRQWVITRENLEHFKAARAA